MMTHKYRRCIVVLSINRSVDPNEEQKVLSSGMEQEISIILSEQIFRGFLIKQGNKVQVNKTGNNCSKWPNPFLAKDKLVEILMRTKRSRGHMGILASASTSYS